MIRFSMIIILFSMFLSCGDDDPGSVTPGSVTLNIKLTYDNEPFVMFKDYTYPSGETFQLSKVSMFISDLKIGDTLIMDVSFFNFTNIHSTEAGAQNGFSYTISDVEKGEFEKLSFNIGVSPENNAKVPGDFSESSALSNAGEYWNHWKSYVFYKIEGQIDNDGDGVVNEGISLHMGGDEVYQNISYSTNIKVESDKTTVITIELDLSKVFDGENGLYNLKTNYALHNKTNHLPFMKELMTNTKNAFILK